MAKRKAGGQEPQHKDYVELHSDVTVRVEPSPDVYENLTKVDSDIKDRMKIAEGHSKYGILIKAGQHRYPASILEWPVVKAMIEAKKFVVKEETDDSNGDAELERQKENLDGLADEPKDGLEALADTKEGE